MMIEKRRIAAEEARARRAARAAGYIARKSRRDVGGLYNLGGFAIIDPNRNLVVIGSRYELSANYVLEWCRSL